ncbi:hypothetical protein ABTX81_30310 [Kitasatospora sp. NPDC097605]|uniref:hypothetical protein n=1 Tax=Kitasatospora sp. NPDC097605 TaxID=3157226 RepID=UPI00332E7C4A
MSKAHPRGRADKTLAALRRARDRMVDAEVATGMPALSLSEDQALQVRRVVRHINGHEHLARLGGGERLTAHLYLAHANRTGYATPGLSRIGALLGVDAESAGGYLSRVCGMGFLRTAGRTRRRDGSVSVHRVAVRSITDAAARGVARRMTAAQCAVLARWTVALLSDEDVITLGPDDRWRLLLAAAEHPRGLFLGEQRALGKLWGLSASGTRKAVARMRKAGVLMTEQLRDGDGRMGQTRWIIIPIAAATEWADDYFAALPDPLDPTPFLFPDGLFSALDRRPDSPSSPFKIHYGFDLQKHHVPSGQDRRPELPGQNAVPRTLSGELSVDKVREVGGTDGTQSAIDDQPTKQPMPAQRQPMRITDGTRLLGTICGQLALGDPRWSQVTGIVLEHQGLVVNGLLAAGWLPTQVRALLEGRNLPHPAEVSTSIGAVVAGRLRAAAAGPVPRPTAFDRAAQVAACDCSSSSETTPDRDAWRAEWTSAKHSSTETANRTVAEATTSRGTMPECEGQDGTCGRPVWDATALCTYCQPTPDPTEMAAIAPIAAAFAKATLDAVGYDPDAPIDLNPQPAHWLDGWPLGSTDQLRGGSSVMEQLIGPIR